jgi:hypothetical protein
MKTMKDVTPEDLEVAKAAYMAFLQQTLPAWPCVWEELPNSKKLGWVAAADAAAKKVFELALPVVAENLRGPEEPVRRGDLVVYGGGL